MHEFADRLFRATLDHRRVVLGVFIVATVICALCIPSVSINYVFADYLPASAPSTQSLDLMKDKFGATTPNVQVYLTGVDALQTQSIVDRMDEVDGVDDSLWLGDVADIAVPIEAMDENLLSAWKSDEGYRLQLSVDTSKSVAVLPELEAIGAEGGADGVYICGEGANYATAQGSSDLEIQIIMIMALIVVFGLLFLTSAAWFEPILFTIIILVAIAINLGTNLIFGTISFITQMCAAVLQLAVSMDYGIVMLHAYRGFRKDGLDSYEATVQAMHKGFSVIASSAGTTFCGFIALCAMTFLVGMDMGLVLAKGVVFSFLTAMFLLPVLIIMTQKPLERTSHRNFLPSFGGFAKACLKVSGPYTVIIALILVPVFLAQLNSSFVYGASGFVQPGSKIYEDTQLIDETFGAHEQWVVLVPACDMGSERALVEDLDALPLVGSTTSYISSVSAEIPQQFVDEDAISSLVNNGYARIVVSTLVDHEGDEAFTLVEQVRELCEKYYGDDYGLVGTAVTCYDESVTVSSDSMRVLLVSVLAIGAILFVMFRSLLIPIILLLSIEISTWINLAIPYFMGTDIQYIGYLVISSIMLGATVDYTIILARSYLDQRRSQLARPAMLAAIKDSAITILTSATILTVCGALIGVISSNGVIAELGTLIGRGAFIAALNTFFLLPCLFILFDKVIGKTTWHANFLPAAKGRP